MTQNPCTFRQSDFTENNNQPYIKLFSVLWGYVKRVSENEFRCSNLGVGTEIKNCNSTSQRNKILKINQKGSVLLALRYILSGVWIQCDVASGTVWANTPANCTPSSLMISVHEHWWMTIWNSDWNLLGKQGSLYTDPSFKHDRVSLYCACLVLMDMVRRWPHNDLFQNCIISLWSSETNIFS